MLLVVGVSLDGIGGFDFMFYAPQPGTHRSGQGNVGIHVGSGDAVTAAIAVALSEGKAISEALIDGMACGAANALNLMSGMIEPEDVDRLRPEVRIETLT